MAGVITHIAYLTGEHPEGTTVDYHPQREIRRVEERLVRQYRNGYDLDPSLVAQMLLGRRPDTAQLNEVTYIVGAYYQLLDTPVRRPSAPPAAVTI